MASLSLALPITPASAITIPALNVASPAALPSIVKKVVSAPPSVPLKIMSLSLAAASIVMLPELVVRRIAASPIARLSAASEETEISTNDKSVPSDAST